MIDLPNKRFIEEDNASVHMGLKLSKQRKVTLEEIEAHFGYPVEIV